MKRLTILLTLLVLGCGESTAPDPIPPKWEIVMSNLPAALLSVWGTSANDIWAVGGDPQGTGPAVFHFDGTEWSQRSTTTSTTTSGDLWWVFGFQDGPVYMGGAGGTILRYSGGQFEKMQTPGTGTVFGIWGATPDDVWAVGAAVGGGSGGFAWRLSGDAWVEAQGFPADIALDSAVWKVFGRSAQDVWLVGTNGLSVHWNGTAFERVNTGLGESLFTVHGNADRVIAVGGFGTGLVIENTGAGWTNVTPEGVPSMTGVVSGPGETAFAVGFDGAVLARSPDGTWRTESTNLEVYESLHGAWLDPSGGLWVVGGQTAAFPLVRGVMLHRTLGGQNEED